jgi:serine/threonine-protein kinase RsbW
LRFEADSENLSHIRRFVQEKATALGADTEAVGDLLIAANEAAANIVAHGYQGRSGVIDVEVTQKGDYLEVLLRDQAQPFDPTTIPPPDTTVPLEQRPYGGMGMHLIRELLDNVTYRFTPQGENELVLTKRLKSSGNR